MAEQALFPEVFTFLIFQSPILIGNLFKIFANRQRFVFGEFFGYCFQTISNTLKMVLKYSNLELHTFVLNRKLGEIVLRVFIVML